MLRSWSSVTTANDQGVDLLSESVVKEFESAWRGTYIGIWLDQSFIGVLCLPEKLDFSFLSLNFM